MKNAAAPINKEAEMNTQEAEISTQEAIFMMDQTHRPQYTDVKVADVVSNPEVKKNGSNSSSIAKVSKYKTKRIDRGGNTYGLRPRRRGGGHGSIPNTQ